MKKRKFLMPLAALAAVFISDQVTATVSTPEASSTKIDSSQATTNTAQNDRVLTSNGKDQFSFVLKRDEAGQLMAWHESHWSHSSHSSHSSHRSHYSGW